MIRRASSLTGTAEKQVEMPKERTQKRKKKALGMGLGALIPDIDSIDNMSNEYFQCDIELIQPNRYQPRTQFPEDELAALSHSIKEQGVIQPLLLRRIDDGYELVAGERRLRAARMAGQLICRYQIPI